jgi:hypothetical protein
MMKKLFLLSHALLLAACSGAQPDLSSYDRPDDVQVTFNVLIPENSPANEPVIFTILDDVTGLAFNPQRFQMQSNGERSFTINMAVPAGTLLKYRYTRQAAAGNIEELGASGESIPYRIYWVNGPAHVAHDMVAAWSDLPFSQSLGQVSGTITDAATGLGIPNLTVVGAGLHRRTGADGRYRIEGLPQGLHNITVYSTEGTYLPFQQGALVATDSDTPASLQLTPNLMTAVTFLVTLPDSSLPTVPIYIEGDHAQFGQHVQLTQLSEGNYGVTLQLPSGVDIRYKYTLGDGFWNAEHNLDGSFLLRQLIIPSGTTELTINDQIPGWTAGSSAPIWFDLTAPDPGSPVYIQFKLLEWTEPLLMWSLGGGQWAYLLYSPTNFSTALEYRYCLDASCSLTEAAPGQPRTVTGNAETMQQIEDRIDAWQTP